MLTGKMLNLEIAARMSYTSFVALYFKLIDGLNRIE